jgi:hypothetical protein
MEGQRDYQKGKIYKLYITGLEDYCYIGSTTTTLAQRYASHKGHAKSDTQKKTRATILFEQEEEPIIELIEEYSCNSKLELENRERYWLAQFPDCVNKNIPTQDWKERWLKNREHNLQKHKEWVESNKEHIKKYEEAYKPQRRANSVERKAKRDADPKAKEEYLQKRREIKNREKSCEVCGFKTTAGNMWRHTKTHKP